MASFMRLSGLLRVAGARRLHVKSPEVLLNSAPTQVTYLDHGLRVASESNQGETATIGVWIDTGSRMENERNNGTAHFLEHMAFKGTSSRTQRSLEREIENLGGHLNAYTSREHTVYYAQVLKNDVPKAVDILADILQRSKLEEKDIEIERGVILQEYDYVAKNYEEVVCDYLHETAYQGSSLGRTILGPKKNIKSLTRDDLVQFVKSYYTTPRMVIAAAGGVDHDALCKLSEKAFADLPTASPEGVKANPEPATYRGSDVRVFDETVPLAHFAFAVESVPVAHPDQFALQVVSALLGSWDRTLGGGKNVSTTLGRAIAEENLAQSVSSFHNSYRDTGLFGLYCVTEPENCDALINTIQNNLVRLCFSPTPEEVERAKNTVKANALLGLDGNTACFEDIGRQVLQYGRRLTPAEIFARIDAVNVDHIKRVANTYIYDQNPVLAAYGSVQEIPDMAWLRSGMYWWRV